MATETHTDGARQSVTLHDVAREVGLHFSTVSRALDPARSSMVRPATRERIVEAADRIGYRPDMIARGLTTGRTATVGLIVADLGNPWVTPIIHGVASHIEPAGSLPMIAETQDSSERFADIVQHMLSRRVDAIIALAARREDREQLERAARSVPVVVAARPLEGTTLPIVTHDDADGATMIADHLAALGHGHVAQIVGPDDVLNFAIRSEVFSSQVAALGLKELVMPAAVQVPIEEQGRQQMEAILAVDGPRPTAIFSANDAMAVGAIAAIRGAGLRIPEDISIVGYNDMPFVRHMTPALTTARYPGWEVGQRAADTALEILAGGEPQDVRLEASLVIRNSTAEPANS